MHRPLLRRSITLGLAAGLGWMFTPVLIAYLAKTTAYSKWLKHIPVVDVAAVDVGSYCGSLPVPSQSASACAALGVVMMPGCSCNRSR